MEDEGATALAGYLKNAPALTALDLTGNELTGVGVAEIANAVSTSKSITSLE